MNRANATDPLLGPEDIADYRAWRAAHPARGIDRRFELALVRDWEWMRQEIDRLRAERDAYKRAKAENDERYMLERDEARAEVARLRAASAAAKGER